MRKKENSLKLCSRSGLKMFQLMSRTISMRKCWKMKQDSVKKDYNDSGLKSWAKFMFLTISCDQNQHKSTVIFPQNSTSLWQDQCLGTVRWTSLIESTKTSWKEDKRSLKKSSTEMLTSTCLKEFREWSRDKISFPKKEQQRGPIQQVLLETARLHQRSHMGFRISRPFMSIFTSILRMQRIIRSLSSCSLSLLKIDRRSQEPHISKRTLKKVEGSSLTQSTKK